MDDNKYADNSKYVKLTILHSNDLHGDFLPHEENGKMVGGLSRLSGYVKKIRKEEKNVIYLNAGDMFNGSIIDSEYRGLGTVLMLNQMTIDCATIGNHEVDYGVPHLTFVNRCTSFPIVNANLFIPLIRRRLFDPYVILECGGLRIVIVGFITQSAIQQTKNDELISSILEIEDPETCICNYLHTNGIIDADIYILLTHIGYDEDIKLVQSLYEKNLNPHLIIGGHSHTLPQDMVITGGTAVVQAGSGSGHIGRIDLIFNKETSIVEDLKWQCIEISEETAPEDEVINEILDFYVKETDLKYNCVLTVLDKDLTHPVRYKETELGNFFCDIVQDVCGAEIVFLGAGSIRGEILPKLVTRKAFLVVMPYANELVVLNMTGKQVRTIWQFIMERVSAHKNVSSLQVSRGFRVRFDREKGQISELSLNGEEITDDRMLRVCMQKFTLDSIEDKFGISLEELRRNGRFTTIAVSDQGLIIDEITNPACIKDANIEGRIIYEPPLEF